MSKFLSISLFLLSLVSHLNAISLEGKLIDAKTKAPIPFVNIGLKNTAYGTASNSLGYFIFNLPEKGLGDTLYFSCIGYQTKAISVPTYIRPVTIQLQPVAIPLNEVRVMPDRTLRDLLKRAASQIPENYSATPSLLSGFYREILTDAENKDNIRFVEALIESYKTPYSDKRSGTVKVSNSRRYISGSDFFPSYFYGGMHITHLQDLVKYRSRILTGSYEYDYTLLGLRSYNNQRVYEIAFSPAEEAASTLTGSLFVEEKSLAYVKIDLEYTQSGLTKRSRALSLKDFYPTFHTESIVYDLWAGKYFLKSISVHQSFQDSNNNKALLSAEYVTTHLDTDNPSKIPFQEQVGSSYTPSLDADDYRLSDWQGYNVLAFPGSLNLIDTIEGSNIIRKEARIDRSLSERVMNSLLKLEYSLKSEWMPISAPSIEYDFTHYELNLSGQRAAFSGAVTLQSHLGYRLTRQFGLFLQSTQSLDERLLLRQYNLGGRFYLPLQTLNRLTLLNFDGGITSQKMGLSLGQTTGNEPFRFGSKKFSADKIQTYTGLRQVGMKIGTGFNYQLSSQLYLDLGISYVIPFVEKELILIQEKSGFFLFRKSAHESLSDKELKLQMDGKAVKDSGIQFKGWSYGAGLKMMF